MKTFGSIHREAGRWIIEAQPDIAVRLKRIFPRVQATKLGTITIEDSAEVARDLEWVLTRWPMDITEVDTARLSSGADEHRQTEETVTAILSGKAEHTDLPLEPAPEKALREYQQVAHDLVTATGSLLLADDLGLGKTISALAALSDPANRPMLAVVLNGLQRQWIREAGTMFPDLLAVEAEKAKPYDLSVDGRTPDLIVMNYAKLAGWSHHLAGEARSVVFDEIQELRRDKSDKHRAAQMVAGPARIVTGASATPVYNYGGEMYSIYSVLRPELVGDKAEFAREWCKSTYGLDPKTRIADPEAFREWLIGQGAFLRRTRADVGIDLPDLSTQDHYLDVGDDDWTSVLASSDAAEVARLILSDETSPQERWRAGGQLDYRMRHATGVTKAPYVAQLAKLILESEEKIILAGWHRDCYDIWHEALAEYNPVLYTGTESGAGKQRSFEAFTDGDARVLMMSLRSGAGLDGLQGTCNFVLFGELDWSPGVHKQALGRLHRPGQSNPVTGIFAHTDYGSDPVMMDTLDIKSIEADLIVNGPSPTVKAIDADTQRDRMKALARAALHGTKRQRAA